MKKRKQRKGETSRAADFSTTNDKATTHSDHRKKWWPGVSMGELIKDHLGSTDKAALAAEYVVGKQVPGCVSGIGDRPTQKTDQNGGD